MTYEPDEQDELTGDAMAVGGAAFVEELHYAAMEAAQAACPWDGDAEEPADYRRAWIGAACALVARRRERLTTLARPPAEEPAGGPQACAGVDPAIGP